MGPNLKRPLWPRVILAYDPHPIRLIQTSWHMCNLPPPNFLLCLWETSMTCKKSPRPDPQTWNFRPLLRISFQQVRRKSHEQHLRQAFRQNKKRTPGEILEGQRIQHSPARIGFGFGPPSEERSFAKRSSWMPYQGSLCPQGRLQLPRKCIESP